MLAEKLLQILEEEGINLVPYLPCEKIRYLLHLLHSRPILHPLLLNREEDGIGIGGGSYLVGGKPALLIQSSGLGNSLNALLSLSVTYGLPLPILASWRGTREEKIPAQIPFNRPLPEALRVWGIKTTKIEKTSELEEARKTIRKAYEEERPRVILLSPRLWEGEPEVQPSFPPRKREIKLRYRKTFVPPEMTRYEAIKVVAEEVEEEEILVSNLGFPSRELYQIKDRPLNFYMLGSYTQASSIGLGMSLSTERKVVVLEGDGSVLGSSLLSVLGAEGRENLRVVCLDNGTLGSTGDQLTYSYLRVDLELMALAAGVRTTRAFSPGELRKALGERGPCFIHVPVKPGNEKVGLIPLTPEEIKRRFRRAVGVD
ncbi:MAG: sulfopyruvate decarboxylase subunit alpha [Candidatus Hadarchaeales archaeon]